MRACVLAVGIGLLVAPPATAKEADWARAFDVDALRSHVQQLSADRYLVVPGKESGDAAKALETALRATGRVSLVIDSAALGEVGAADDAAIVKLANHLPIDALLIVRVFGNDAVVMGYDRFGGTLGAFTASLGKRMKPAPGTRVATEADQGGVTPPAGRGAGVAASGRTQVDASAGASAGALASINRLRQEAEARYNQKFLDITDYKDVLGNVMYSEPVQGSQRTVLDWPKFYRVVGRKDLAEKYNSNVTTKALLSYVGGPGLVLGSLVAAGYSQNLTVAVIGVPVGIVVGLAGVLMGVQPMNQKERQALVKSYNESLRTEVGWRSPPPNQPVLALRPPFFAATFTF